MNGKFKFIFGLIELCLMASMPLFNNTKNPKQNLITINENIKKENKDSTKLKVEMIDLGCNGDSTLISFGKTQILVDAGGNEKSGPAIINTLSNELINIQEFRIVDDFNHILNEYLTSSQIDIIHTLNDKINNIKISPIICYEIAFPNSIIDKNNKPDIISIIKYLGLIFSLQYLHFAPKKM